MKQEYNNHIMDNETMMAIYPRRLAHTNTHEIWQFPYFKDDLLEDEPDFVVIIFGETSNAIHLFCLNESRASDTDYLQRVQLLVHDIAEFTMTITTVSDPADYVYRLDIETLH